MAPVDQSELSNSYYFTQTISHSGIAILYSTLSFFMVTQGSTDHQWTVMDRPNTIVRGRALVHGSLW